MMIIVYFSTAIKGSSLTLYFTFMRVLSIHANPYQALSKIAKNHRKSEKPQRKVKVIKLNPNNPDVQNSAGVH